MNMKKKLHILQATRTALKAEAGKLAGKLDDENYDFTDDETKRADEIVNELKAVEQQITTAENLNSIKLDDDPATPSASIPASPVNTAERDMNGFSDLGEFATAVHQHCTGSGTDDRLMAQNPTDSHQETNSSDGLMVPTQFRRDIWELVIAEGGFMSMITSEDTIGNNVELLRDESTPWGALGIQAFWGSELGQLTPSRLNTDPDVMVLNKLHAFAESSDELLQDAPRLTSRLSSGAARAINFKLDQAIFEGNGAGKPEGLTNSGALVVVAKESGQSADTIVSENVVAMYARQWNVRNAVWLANIDIFPQLATMTIGDQPMYQPPAGLAAAPFGTLLGRPIIYNDHSDTLGDQNDLVFADMSGYYGIKKTGGVKFAESMHLFFDRDAHAFRWTFRFNGQTFMSQPVTPNKGGNTKSQFVSLAVRA